ncbi:transmembrane protein, putative (macronuclear) [Tetrahymena thermophila SB210]|uniref:Transmembrane protein, putative n=1 Tax=Tetrahymena thermophila (strain SB210) TaxID=312017 RepID=W7XDQ4_TETTS|nr:transmembrane protein, putative [Tetrahymena thermophila SB210]EWS71981.1 transmembrane protein, putative [Tetrahymena thermophila SB210]|eukprot:XP_012655481.1 transmembrane protein, putative [Tetrahymena thermophila SB210]
MEDNTNSVEDQIKNRVFSYKKLYQSLFVEGSNLLKLEKEELQEFIYENYRNFIALQGEYDEFFKEFGEIKSNFSQFENSLKYIFENVNEVRQRKLMVMKKKIEQKHSYSDSDDSEDEKDEKQSKNSESEESEDSSDDNEDNYSRFQNQQKLKKEKEEMAEQINEFLDNISINTFEKNYNQAIQALEVLQNMKKSEKYSLYLNQFDIRKTLETHYQTLVDSIVNDLISENPLTKLQDLIQYLKDTKQTQRAVEGYLEIKKRNLAQLINSKIAQVGKLEAENTVQITEEYANFILQVYGEFSLLFLVTIIKLLIFKLYLFIFKRKVKKMSTLRALFVIGLIKVALSFSVVFNKIYFGAPSQKKYWRMQSQFQMSSIKKKIKTLAQTLLFKGSSLMNQNVKWMKCLQHMHKGQLECKMLMIEIGNPDLQPVQFISEIDIPEVKRQILANAKPVKDPSRDNLDSGYKKYLLETNLKGARHSILFWNTIFQLIDKVVQNVDIDSRRIFSSQLIALIESKIQLFISEYVNSFKEVLSNVANFTENQLLAACANINTCLQFSKFAKRYESIKLRPHIKLDHDAWENQWKKQINLVYNSCFDLVFSYFKFKILLHIPRLFSEYRKVYIAPSDKELGKSPSPLFIKIAYILENIKDNLSLIMSQNDIIFYFSKLMEAINYMIEYIIYWEYHWIQKGQNVFFMSQKDIQRLNLEPYMDQINVYLSQNALQISYFNKENMKQFIFDIHFLAILFNAYLCKESKPEAKINNEKFLNKAIACYCKRKNYNIKDFPFSQMDYKQSLMDYCIKQYKSDINSLIIKERESVLVSQSQGLQQSKSTNGQTNVSSFTGSGRNSIKERIFAINLTMQKNY